MSVTSSISIKFTKNVDAIEVIMAFLKSEWVYVYHGAIMYLPLHDQDMYDWQYDPVEEWQRIISLLEKKRDQREPVGLAMSSDTEGATFSFDGGANLSIILDADRRKLVEGQPFTDFSWYLKKIVCPLIAAKFSIEYLECSDVV